MKNKFYDIHFHSLDLSHANLTAFISRISFLNDEAEAAQKPSFFKRIGNFFKGILNIPKYIKMIWTKVDNKFANTRNLLAFMESTIRYDFLILDYFLRHSKEVPIADKNNCFKIEGRTYNKMVICPLIIDFGYQSKLHDDYFYNLPTKKPIQDQVLDLLESIHTYYTHEMVLRNVNGPKEKPIKKLLLETSDKPKDEKLFEIYPFLGINTNNYSLEELKRLFNKYFGGYENDSPEERQQKLYDKMGTFVGRNLEDLDDYTYFFAGIKVYPPIGFDPYPEHKAKALAKVDYLYTECIRRNIPITTHCSDGGFVVSEKSELYTHPASRWSKVLEKYPELKLNFAHFGTQSDKSKREWEEKIIELVDLYPQVYTDISCLAFDDEYYKELNDTLNSSPNSLKKRLLFGSDFVINLLWSKSYNHYIKDFKCTKHLKNKQAYCQDNAETFLFGGVLNAEKREKEEALSYSI